MIKVAAVCMVLFVAVMLLSTQVDAQNDKPNLTEMAPPKSAGFMVLPCILSLILPTGLLMSLFHEFHC